MNPNETYFNEFQNKTTDHKKHGRDFMKEMIALIHKRKPLWERDSHDKDLKIHLWQETANILGTSVDACQQRWKGIREKYIRQKRRYLESGEKWEYLDDLSFLDSAISYRKRYAHPSNNYNNDSQFDQFSCDSDVIHNTELYPESDASSGMIKTEEPAAIYNRATGNADSTLNENLKKREVCSSDGEEHAAKKKRCEHARTPEEIFGEFVAASLATKSTPERNLAMVEIMTILTRTN